MAASGDGDRPAGDVAGLRIRKYDVGCRKLGRLTRPLHWHVHAKVGHGLFSRVDGIKVLIGWSFARAL